MWMPTAILTATICLGGLNMLTADKEPNYKQLYDAACRDIDKLYKMNDQQKREHEELKAKHKDTEAVAMKLTERNGELQAERHELSCENIDLRQRLEAAERCIVNMAMQLHGGDDDA